MTEIQINDDFDLDRIADSGQCFRWEKTGEGAYRIIHRDHCLEIRSMGSGKYGLSCDENEFCEVWREYFDLDENYCKIRRRVHKKEDPFLYRACEYGKGIRILRQDPWEMLISFIISQNKNIPAIRRSIDLLCRMTGKEALDAGGSPFFIFPSPEEILSLDSGSLSSCRLGYRCKYVRAAAEDVAGGHLDLDILKKEPPDSALKQLTKVYGVGIKVANCVSLFGLHHIDAFPVDVWIRRILEQYYPDGWPLEKYSPYNGIYQQYMFYYVRNTQAKNGVLSQ